MKLTNLPEVDVLLATYNGEKYIEELLVSLENQNDVDINLIISDDGSSDSTLKIASQFGENFKSLKIVHGPGKGPALNFHRLLIESSSKYIAFADQDDIWLADHLKNSISRIDNYPGIPVLTYSSVTEFFEDGRKDRVWPGDLIIQSISIIAFQNFARGCTIVMNSLAKDLLISKPFQNIVMHDWWAYLVLKTCGLAIYSNVPEVRYRIHDTNFIGLERKHAFKRLKMVWGKNWEPVLQLKSLLDLYGTYMKIENYNELAAIDNILSRKFFKRLIAIGLFPHRLRRNIGDECKIRIAMIIIPVIWKKDWSN